MAAIASKVGLAKATVFHHFPTKDALVVALYMRCLDSARRLVPDDDDPGRSVEDLITQYCMDATRWALLGLREHRFLINEMNQTNIPELQSRRWEGFDSLMRILERGKSEGLLKDLETTLLAEIIVGILAFSEGHLTRSGNRSPDARILEAISGVVWDAIRA